ncbi:MAG: flagellar basal body P-ring formation chaperone FlgA [Desulfosalsimonas sp.]
MHRLVLCILTVLVFSGQALGLEIRFKETATAGSQKLGLAVVAEIIPESRADEFAGVELFAAPAPGEQKCYKSSTLKAYVREAVSGGGQIKWSGAERVCVRHEGAMVTAEKLESLINQELESALAHLDADRIRFDMRARPKTLSLPEGNAEYEVVFSDRNVIDSRKATVIVKVDGQVAENLSIPGRVEAEVPVAAAAGKLSRGDVIAESDVTMKPVNIAGLRRPCLEKDKAVGKRLRRPVGPGKPISKSDLERPVLVKRRQMVTMVLENGALHLQTRGVAEENGKKGDLITVKNMRSGREVSCQVTGQKKVRVEY